MRSQMSSEGLFDGELAGVFGRLLTAPRRLPWHLVQLHYRPKLFTVGINMAAAAIVAFASPL